MKPPIKTKKPLNTKRSTGYFISFEGGEGAGKTTLIDRLEANLISRGLGVVRTREPGGTPLGEAIRGWLLNQQTKMEIGANAEVLLFLAARVQHINDFIVPAIQAGKIVLCDRFNDSTIAYQGAGRKLGIPWVTKLCKMACGKLEPDLTFYLDVDPHIGLERTQNTAKDTAKTGEKDRIESEALQFHEQVRQAFLEIAKKNPKRFYVINAHEPKEKVFKSALEVIDSHMHFKFS